MLAHWIYAYKYYGCLLPNIISLAYISTVCLFVLITTFVPTRNDRQTPMRCSWFPLSKVEMKVLDYYELLQMKDLRWAAAGECVHSTHTWLKLISSICLPIFKCLLFISFLIVIVFPFHFSSVESSAFECDSYARDCIWLECFLWSIKMSQFGSIAKTVTLTKPVASTCAAIGYSTFQNMKQCFRNIVNCSE